MLGLKIDILNASSERDIDTVQQRAGALVVAADAFLITQRHQLAALALRHAVPSIFTTRQDVYLQTAKALGLTFPARVRAARLIGRIMQF